MKIILLLVGFLLFPFELFCCTTFSFSNHKGEVVFGRNFDFPVGMGHIAINNKNVYKTAFIRPPEKAISWTSTYGSITFNQCGKEFPYGGMNEAGLVIEQMWLQEAAYPEADKRFGLSELQWIQYQLDNSATVEQVVNSDSLVRISYTAIAPLHFLIADASGNVATIEYIEGKMIVHQGKNLPYQVLANCTYQNSLSYKRNIELGSDKKYNDWTRNSSGRFSQAASLIDKYDEKQNIVDYSFLILDSVAQVGGTQWSIVYDITNLVIYYRTSLNPTIQKIAVRELSFDYKGVVLFTGIAEKINSIKDFKKLTYEINLAMMDSVVSGVEFLRNNVPKDANEAAAKYAQSLYLKERINIHKKQ